MAKSASSEGRASRVPRGDGHGQGSVGRLGEKRNIYGGKVDGSGTYERHIAPKQYHVGKEHTQSMTKGTSPCRLKPIQMVALVALLAVSAFTQGVLAAEYTVTDLGTLGGTVSSASGINAAGQVMGNAQIPDSPSHAFL